MIISTLNSHYYLLPIFDICPKIPFICVPNLNDMSEQPIPPRRAPRKKLKMPLFGNMGGGSSSGNTTSVFGMKNFTSTLFIVGAVGLLLQMYLPKLWAEKMYDTESEIREMALDGVIRKKFADPSNRSEIHYILVVKEKTGRKKIDLYLAKPDFFDQVAVPQRLKKKSGELAVQVTRYSKPDTIINIRF